MDKKEKIPVRIYVLIDPITKEIRYVGSTTRNLSERLSQHKHDSLNKKGTHKKHWLSSLYKKGLLPIIQCIETCNLSNYQDRETFWINYYSKRCNLTNTRMNAYGIVRDKNEDAVNKSAQSHHIPIVQLDKSGNYIQTWGSVVEAVNHFNLANTAISNVLCRRSKSSCGYFWFYESDYLKGTYMLPKYKEKNKKLRKAIRKIKIIHEDDTFLIFNNIKESAKYLNIDNSTLTKHLNYYVKRVGILLKNKGIKTIIKL